ncbi:DUF370 domain-containing protein [Salipaludibacillus agaradhaerens]|jgi:hypothetical protein|uniref:DUF370 domain-containing protein n=1 Tax=Salipaludibacillus agaradhaerens TaxID=76935 RepID=A0A9Q4B5R7_SALAG|nr:extracellular matrix/biofilm biosynthesis regulator RemA family protein [Salipaludibacillus agaradhaerens]MCR6098472.1 DUF370 domain-containing protein [Salipaludibacillus agaradhaerens]MCR6108753.1 DUF370 domain-containing protein [Bacillus sp. A301a_S52]MCR6115898.1 DUF370 domain-containing protein [Salipaludibacillus agaradhaerens]
MFIHLGGDMVLKAESIVAILDHNSQDLSEENQEMMKDHKKRKATIRVTDDTPKSMVITKKDIYLSPISSHTLKRRAETITVLSEEDV